MIVKTSVKSFWFSLLIAAGALGFAAVTSSTAWAVDTEPTPAPSAKPAGPAAKPAAASSQKKKQRAKKQKKSDLQFIEGYKVAHTMIYQQNDYVGGMAKLKSLGRDEHPDVANLIGFTSRKLGRYGDAKHWYEKALIADPKHAVTWSYYGMWHAEQGNLLKARDHLAKLQTLCGNTQCREYVMLKEVIEGTRAY